MFGGLFVLFLLCLFISPGSSSDSKLEKNFWGDPMIKRGFWRSGSYVTIDGKRYDIVGGQSGKLEVKEAGGIFGGGRVKIVEKGLLGNTIVRDKGIFE